MTTTYSMTEAELIEGCLSGNRAAQKLLYDRYNRAMYTIVYRMTNDFELSNDVLQEAFVKIFRGLPGFRSQSTLGAWIKTIVIRTALSRLKQVQRHGPTEQVPEDARIDWGGHGLDTEYLEKAIQALPEGYRAVFVLIEVEGYAHQEVADMLGVSVGTTKSQLFHAKKRLRQTLRHLME